MARPDTPILNRLAQVNDGRSAITGEHSGQGFLGSKRMGAPILSAIPAHRMYPRWPEKDTETEYAFRKGVGTIIWRDKSIVDGK